MKLQDQITTEVFYGGAAGGGKSFLGCVWLIISCIQYPGSRWLMGRAVLKNLKESTLLTFFQIISKWGINQHWKYNSIEGTLTYLPNGSQVYLKDLFLYPSDPEFDSLGSTEFTGAFIDECSQVTKKAKNIVMSRIRYKLEEFKLIPKTLLASNPSKNFLYYDFYQPWKDKTLPEYRAFIPALVQDNPYISEHYIANLQKLDEVSKQRLLYGNFEYDDDPSRLLEYDDIISLFKVDDRRNGKKYISADIARFGGDSIRIILWDGLHIEKILTLHKTSIPDTAKAIENLAIEHTVPYDRIVIDEDGVGGGVVDLLKGTKGFVNNSKAIPEELAIQGQLKTYNYSNLKAQCYWKLAEYIKARKISCFEGITPEDKQTLIEELEQIKRKDPDKDAPLQVIPKDKIKELIGRSPDLSDALMMRMVFEFQIGEDYMVLEDPDGLIF